MYHQTIPTNPLFFFIFRARNGNSSVSLFWGPPQECHCLLIWPIRLVSPRHVRPTFQFTLFVIFFFNRTRVVHQSIVVPRLCRVQRNVVYQWSRVNLPPSEPPRTGDSRRTQEEKRIRVQSFQIPVLKTNTETPLLVNTLTWLYPLLSCSLDFGQGDYINSCWNTFY